MEATNSQYTEFKRYLLDMATALRRHAENKSKSTENVMDYFLNDSDWLEGYSCGVNFAADVIETLSKEW